MNDAAWRPHPSYGRDLLATLPRRLFERPVVLTQPEPWALVRDRFPADARVHLVTDMEHDAVRARSDALGEASAVFGIGGGMALDHAKYTAWHRGLPLVLAPSILSVDAAYTRAVGVREGGRVRYVGDAHPAHLLVDFALLQAAPPLLNRAGAGDILSIYTALWDWKVAHDRLGEPWDAALAADARAVLERLAAGAAELHACSEQGLTLLSELYVEEVWLCERWGNARPEEGSEHTLAYALEALTGGHYVHGQLIGLCALVAAARQGQDVAWLARLLAGLGLDCRYEAVGTTRGELREALLGIDAYVARETQILPGVFHLLGPVDAAEADALLDTAERALAGAL